MSYPRDLEEHTDAEIWKEAMRRRILQARGQCTYCERPITSEVRQTLSVNEFKVGAHERLKAAAPQRLAECNCKMKDVPGFGDPEGATRCTLWFPSTRPPDSDREVLVYISMGNFKPRPDLSVRPRQAVSRFRNEEWVDKFVTMWSELRSNPSFCVTHIRVYDRGDE